jgi:hypothetical protein
VLSIDQSPDAQACIKSSGLLSSSNECIRDLVRLTAASLLVRLWRARKAISSAIGTVITAASVRKTSHAILADAGNPASLDAIPLSRCFPLNASNPSQRAAVAAPMHTPKLPQCQSSCSYASGNHQSACSGGSEKTERIKPLKSSSTGAGDHARSKDHHQRNKIRRRGILRRPSSECCLATFPFGQPRGSPQRDDERLSTSV